MCSEKLDQKDSYTVAVVDKVDVFPKDLLELFEQVDADKLTHSSTKLLNRVKRKLKKEIMER